MTQSSSCDFLLGFRAHPDTLDLLEVRKAMRPAVDEAPVVSETVEARPFGVSEFRGLTGVRVFR